VTSVHVKPSILNSSAEWLTVIVETEEGPLPTDWIGIYSPLVNGTIDYLYHEPIKTQVNEFIIIIRALVIRLVCYDARKAWVWVRLCMPI